MPGPDPSMGAGWSGVNDDIELEIGPDKEPDAFTVKVLHSVAGGCPATRLMLDTESIHIQHDQLESTVLASSVQRRRVLPQSEQPLQEVGRQLFEAVFTGAVGGAYRASLGAVQQTGKRLRVGLHLRAPELAALPWEAMFDRETGTYLCRTEPLIRHVDAPYTPQPLEVRLPLHILGLAASPRGLPMLDVEAEQQRLEQALAKPLAAGQVEINWAPDASWETIHDLMLDGIWHILHFIGHGGFDPGSDEGVLALVGPDGRADLVEASRLTDLLSEADPTPQLVVLNSCSSGQAGAHDLFSGTAATLVHGGISAAAAMQFSISDVAAIKFARGFYNAIARGRAIDEAVRSGRIEILGTPHTLEWVTPVLYVRGGVTQLFRLAGSPAPGPVASHPSHVDLTTAETPALEQQLQTPSGPSQAALHALYIQARGELHVQHYDTALKLLSELLSLDPGHPEATDLLERARRGKQLAEAYTRGRAAQDTGDWATAITQYDIILQADPDFQDTGRRRQHCHKQQQIADCQTELHYHYDAGNWQAVLDVDTELASLDPAATDPDNLTTKAREQLRRTDLETRYEEARSSEEAHNWTAAGSSYGEIARIDPAYKDAAERHETCTKRAKSEYLMVMMRMNLDAKDWAAVRANLRELKDCDPETVDTQLIDRARHEIDINLHLQERAHIGTRINFGSAVYSVAWHKNSGLVAVAGRRAWVHVYDLSSRNKVLRVKAGTWIQHVPAVAFSPDGERLATGGTDSKACIWNATTGALITSFSHGGNVTAVAFSPDGERLATGSADKKARIWNAITGEVINTFSHNSEVASVALNSVSSLLATGGNDHNARVWDVTTGAQLDSFHYEGRVNTVAFSPAGTLLATGSDDNSVRVWHI